MKTVDTNLDVNYQHKNSILNNNKAFEARKSIYIIEKKYKTEDPNKLLSSISEEGKRMINEPKEIENYKNLLKNAFTQEVPLIYLNKNQKKGILDKCKFAEITQDGVILFQCVSDISSVRKVSHAKSSDNDEYDGLSLNKKECFILLDGEVHCFNKNNQFTEQLISGNLFGYNTCIFEKSKITALAQKGSKLCIISQELLFEVIEPFSKFCNYIQKSIINNKYFQPLDEFKKFVLSCVNEGALNIPLTL